MSSARNGCQAYAISTGPGWSAQVFAGRLLGSRSPVPSWTPLVGAELRLDAGTAFPLDVDPSFEHGVLVDAGSVTVGGREVTAGQLAYVPVGTDVLMLHCETEPARLVLLGGPPFGEQIVMWWNFVGRSHDALGKSDGDRKPFVGSERPVRLERNLARLLIDYLGDDPRTGRPRPSCVRTLIR